MDIFTIIIKDHNFDSEVSILKRRDIMNFKFFITFLISLSCFNIILSKIEIPKIPHLESLKAEINSKLNEAKEKDDQNLIEKYQLELETVEKKIKNFKIGWLNFKKRQLTIKLSSVEENEGKEIESQINEIDELLKKIEEKNN